MAVSPSPSPSSIPDPPKADADPLPTSTADNPNPTIPPPLQPSFTLPPSAPSFRPVGAAPQFSPIPPAPAFPNPSLQPPGVPTAVAGPQMGMYPGAVPRPFPPIPAGYAPPLSVPAQQLQPLRPPGIARYSAPYASIVRPPVFPPRPPGALPIIPPLSRPPIPGTHGAPPVVRAIVPIIAPAEKPQTTVYLGKIAPTVDDDFLLPVLRLCGPVKSWKRARDPSDGTPKSFAFCEFESAEGVLRALRLLCKLSIDGQELVLNVNQATRGYLERYVEKKTERERLKEAEAEAEGGKKDTESAPGVETVDIFESAIEDSKADSSDTVDEDTKDPQKFGIVTEDDREADKEALVKLTSMIEERMENRPPPPPPLEQSSANVAAKSSNEVPTKSKDVDSDLDAVRNDSDEDKNDDETSDNKPSSEPDKLETSSSADKSKKYDKNSREKDRERDLKREERELDRYERERERERIRRERDREVKIREADRLYKERVKEWESRERDKEYQRLHEKDRDKEKERERRREIKDQEEESDDEDAKKRRRRNTVYEERRRKRRREKDDDLADRLREEVEIAEAKNLAVEKEEAVGNVIEKLNMDITMDDVNNEDGKDEPYKDSSTHMEHSGDAISESGGNNGFRMDLDASDSRLNNDAPVRKLGFGLVGSGKRTAVLSVFHEEDEEDANKEKKMRPLVPIDYTKEELQAVQSSNLPGGMPPNLAAAAEFAKRISNGNTKEDRSETERGKNKWLNDRSSQRQRERNNEEISHGREDDIEKDKTTDNKKLLDAKQLIDMIPKTKEELFSYEINWSIYDKHDLHERMRPWISKKITEFLGEEEATLVEYIVSSTKEHVKASQMLDLLQSILDDEAEMFVLKMWRMLIFEIKKVETGLSLKCRG